jgi:FtsH-binding integral membrane protein
MMNGHFSHQAASHSSKLTLPTNNLQHPGPSKHFVNIAESPTSVRLAFIRKVYFLLTLQLLVTFGLAALFYGNPEITQWIRTNTWMMIVAAVLSLLLGLVMSLVRRRHPWNLIVLLLFTLCIAYTVALITSYYSVVAIVEAFAITTGVFLAMTAITVLSKQDFSGWRPLLYAGLFVVALASFIHALVTFVFGIFSPVVDIVIAAASALLFSVYIIIATYNILHKVSPEEHIMACMELYLVIINLFLSILKLIGYANGQRSVRR